MSCRRNKVCIGHRVGMCATGYKPGNVGNICHEICANLVCNLPELRKIKYARVCACAGNDEFGFRFEGNTPHFIIINITIILPHPVMDNIVHHTRKILFKAMGKVPTVG